MAAIKISPERMRVALDECAFPKGCIKSEDDPRWMAQPNIARYWSIPKIEGIIAVSRTYLVRNKTLYWLWTA